MTSQWEDIFPFGLTLPGPRRQTNEPFF